MKEDNKKQAMEEMECWQSQSHIEKCDSCKKLSQSPVEKECLGCHTLPEDNPFHTCWVKSFIKEILSSKQSLLLERVGEKREEAGTYDVLCDNETCTAVTAHNKAFDDITKIINEVFSK